MLTLPIKKKWFNMIKSGEKKEEYREIKDYWTKRFSNEIGYHIASSMPHITVKLKNGYSKNAPSVIVECLFCRDYGKPEWGAEPNKMYYVLKILSVEEDK